MQGGFAGVVTLYNRFLENGAERWKRTILNGVEVTDRRGEAVRHSGAASSAARRIGPVSVSEMMVMIPAGVQSGYLSPMGWRMAENRGSCWTLQPGDLLVPERCTLEVGDSTAELVAACDRVTVIGTVTDFTSGHGAMNHWEVTAR